MKNSIYIYRNFKFNGNIYVKIKEKTKFDTARIILFKDGEVFDVKEIQGNFVTFTDNGPGVYKAQAEITANYTQNFVIETKEITVKDEPVSFETEFKNIKKPENEIKRLYNNVKSYYLEFKIKKNNLGELTKDLTSLLQNGYNLDKDTLIFKKQLDKGFITVTDGEIYKLKTSIPVNQMIDIAYDMERFDYVIYCCVTPDTKDLPPPPPFLPADRQIKSPADDQTTNEDDDRTPNFIHLQGYLKPENGMNVLAAWDEKITGHAATVRHLDYGVYRNHENFKDNITVVHSRPETEDCNHGTASTGCIAATKGDFGVTGIAHDCDFYFYDTGDLDVIVQDAFPGDIVSLDTQFSVGDKLIPMIDNKAWWERINILSKNGVIVILAAGNGNLDLSPDKGNINEYGDSGSMLVGSCQAGNGRRHRSSNYNHYTSFIDSWGDSTVTTTGYGSLQKRPGHNRDYCNDYSGTSSATPLSSGALALIQSYAVETYGVSLDSFLMREVMVKTGYNEGVQDGIGFRPNIVKAFRYIDKLLS